MRAYNYCKPTPIKQKPIDAMAVHRLAKQGLSLKEIAGELKINSATFISRVYKSATLDGAFKSGRDLFRQQQKQEAACTTNI